jgi:hypothetical protein
MSADRLRCPYWEQTRRFARKEYPELLVKMADKCPKAGICSKIEQDCLYIEGTEGNPNTITIQVCSASANPVKPLESFINRARKSTELLRKNRELITPTKLL